IDGSLGVNGNIYTLNPTANASVAVANNGLDINGTTNTVSLQADADGLTTNAYTRLNLQPTSASLLVNTDSGIAHGIVVDQTHTVLSGGTNSTSMTLDDSGATFRNDQTGGPAKVTGVADGTSDYDAVNYRQLGKAYSGIAAASALAGIPPITPGKKFAIGGGYGYFEGQSALALGAKYAVNENVTLSGGWGYSSDNNAANAGVGYSW
ncbi:MAG: YadA C-terminal domain-containing protein, partial [Candidatus Omnitrophota bacterium]